MNSSRPLFENKKEKDVLIQEKDDKIKELNEKNEKIEKECVKLQIQIKGLEELCFYAARDSKDPVVQDKFATYIKDYREYGAILKKIAKLSTIRISQTSTKLF